MLGTKAGPAGGLGRARSGQESRRRLDERQSGGKRAKFAAPLHPASRRGGPPRPGAALAVVVNASSGALPLPSVRKQRRVTRVCRSAAVFFSFPEAKKGAQYASLSVSLLASVCQASPCRVGARLRHVASRHASPLAAPHRAGLPGLAAFRPAGAVWGRSV